MSMRNCLLPTVEQCLALTDEQCRLIMDLRDPEGVRAQKNWELPHQAELIRQYMTLRSFTQIAHIMRSKLEWSYKTYANRYRDWLLPADRIERETVVIQLYALVTGRENPTRSKNSFRSYNFPPPIHTEQTENLHYSPTQFNQVYPVVFSQVSSPNQKDHYDNIYLNTVASSSTLSDGSGWGGDSIFDGSLSQSLSVSTCFSSSSQEFQHSLLAQPQALNQGQKKGLQQNPRLQYQIPTAPAHDFKKGLWNSTLRVIPCDQDHSLCAWETLFPPCQTCGFSQCHALMVQAASITNDVFAVAVSLLRDYAKSDYAGNCPIAYLMAAGVGMEYFTPVLLDVKWSRFGNNVFGQSPLHVLNAQNLGEQIINLLEWFPRHLQDRDSRCRTFLHYLFQQPLKSGLYLKLLQIFPNASYYLNAFDTSGKRVVQLMQEVACYSSSRSPYVRDQILGGLVEIDFFLSNTPGDHIRIRPYGFHDIVRGSCGQNSISFDYFDFNYLSRNFHVTNAHSNSCYDQMLRACQQGGIDRNAADDQGWTAAHLLITHKRFNKGPEMMPETRAQTTELFRLLIFSSDLKEAIYVVDPNGNSLVYNIATNGYSAILEYVLGLEEEGRRCAIVNSSGKTKEGQEQSVLQGVESEILDCEWKLKTCAKMQDQMERERLIELYNELKTCRMILKKWGAELHPSAQKRWRIS